MKSTGNLKQDWTLSQCLFGEHLLTKYPEKTVALVEAEKTAVICAGFFPDYVWLATGGKSQLNERLNVLKGRKVVAYPDLDATKEWRTRVLDFPDIDITVSRILSGYGKDKEEENLDLADWIIDWIKKNKK